ncbi:Serine palmitoyltransferase 1 [Spathaspora sp. JA1]|nr:Serine palmitoyltransferase 1 [Spathaspora sp. JA1]
MTTSIISTTVTATTTAIVSEIPPAWELVANSFAENFVYCLNQLDKLPGGQIILRYIKSSYQNDPIRSVFEMALVLFALSYFFSNMRLENKSELVKLSNSEIDELCQEWVPEPLVQPLTELEKWELKTIPEIKGHNGSHITLGGSTHNNNPVVNLASQDFLNLNENESIKTAAKTHINHAGVGACGPPNFYGTQDVHVRLEEDLANFLGAEQSIIYGQDFVTAGSVIPAFLKRGDLCVVDSGVNIAIQKALIVSRADIEWYDHNDVEHLYEILTQLKPVLDKQHPIRRRFIITEALFATTGEITNLPRIVELKNEFKYRLFLDESLSIGVLGKHGKGLPEHFNIPRSEISITIGSMANAFASSGGFCVGTTPMVHHQRIQSNAYVFSASLPPYSAKVTSQAIQEITTTEIVQSLHYNILFAYEQLDQCLQQTSFMISSDPESPMIHIQLHPDVRTKLDLPFNYGNTDFISKRKPSKNLNKFNHFYNIENFILQKIIDYVLQKDILITRSKLILEHENLPVLPPHLIVSINSGITKDEILKLAQVLPEAIEYVMKGVDSGDLLKLEQEIVSY